MHIIDCFGCSCFEFRNTHGYCKKDDNYIESVKECPKEGSEG